MEITNEEAVMIKDAVMVIGASPGQTITIEKEGKVEITKDGVSGTGFHLTGSEQGKTRSGGEAVLLWALAKIHVELEQEEERLRKVGY